MECPPARSTRLLLLIIAALRWGNWLCLGLFAVALAVSVVGNDHLVALLTAKYAGRASVAGAMRLMQVILATGCVSVFVVERLLRALAAVAGSVRAGRPFDPANAEQLRLVGLMLLVLQLFDLGLGVVTMVAHRLHVDFIDWQPSLTGWVAVLVAFVLAHVFSAGAAMRDDLDATI